MGEREFAPTIAGEDPQCDALAILAKRVERDQPLGGRDRLFSISARVGVFGAFLEYVGGNVIELAPRPLDPTIERLFQRELRQEFTAIERRRALEIGGLRRVRKRSEFVRINAYALGPQADRICVDDKDVGVALEQVPAQGYETLSQVVARLVVASLAPEQGGQMLPTGAAVRMHRKVGKQRLAFSGRDAQLQRRVGVDHDRKPPEHPDKNVDGSLPIELAHEANWRIQNDS